MMFLTKQTRPKLWNGYPFLLSALIGDAQDDLILVVTGYDSDSGLVGTQESDPETYPNSIINFNISEVYGSLSGVSYLEVYLKTSLGEILTDTLTIDVEEPCQNPVMLMGRNSLGGVLQWLFDFNQEYNFDYGNNVKNKRLVVFTEGISINQWESLQDFITLGEVYRNNIVEFTSSTIKTHSRVGQQIYVIDEGGSKIGVVIIPTKNKTNTKQFKHILELEIEYPEIF